MSDETHSKKCAEFPFWGSDYPDACCVNGILYDLDRRDENGSLKVIGVNVPCPFCKTEEFISFDPFSLVDHFCEEMEENGDAITGSIEQIAKQKAKKAYLEWIEKMKERYATPNF